MKKISTGTSLKLDRTEVVELWSRISRWRLNRDENSLFQSISDTQRERARQRAKEVEAIIEQLLTEAYNIGREDEKNDQRS